MALPDFRLPKLKELIIHKVLVNFKTLPWSDAPIFRAPQLRRVAIGILPTTTDWSIPSNWSNLQHLFIGTPRRILQFFVAFRDVTECHLRIANSNDIIYRKTPIPLPNLKHLSLSDDTTSDKTSRPLYKNLEIPALVTLEFSAKLTGLYLSILTLLPRMYSLNKLALKFELELDHFTTVETFRNASSIGTQHAGSAGRRFGDL